MGMVWNRWNNSVKDVLLKQLMVEVLSSVHQDDSAQGIWCVTKEEVNAWVDASSLSIGMVLENNSALLEVTCWLHLTGDVQHINMVELDATLKGFNFTLQWWAKEVHLYTYLLCLCHKLTDTLMGKTWVRIKAATKMLVHRRLLTLQLLIKDYSLVVDVNLTTLYKSLADKLACVLGKMLEQELLMCAALMDISTTEQICAIHQKSDHPGVEHTIYFIGRVCPIVPKVTVRSAIQNCEECHAVYLAPDQWKKSKLKIGGNWA